MVTGSSTPPDPYAPPRAASVTDERDVVVRRLRLAMALIASSALIDIASTGIALAVNYSLGPSASAARVLLDALAGLLALAEAGLQVAALLVFSVTAEPARRRFSRRAAILLPALVFLPRVLMLLSVPSACISVAKIAYFMRWVVILPLLGWSLDTAAMPRDRGALLGWALLAVAFVGKSLDALSAPSREHHMMWAFALFAVAYLLFLAATAKQALFVRRLIRHLPT